MISTKKTKSNDGLEEFPSEWVSVNDGHETAFDDGNKRGKLLRRRFLQVVAVPGHAHGHRQQRRRGEQVLFSYYFTMM